MSHFIPNQDFLAELRWRGLIHDLSHEEELRAHLQMGARRGYIGFDPTADSLTIGNLVSIKILWHWQQAGHMPVVVVGGGTGLIGDPSGKSAERMLLTVEGAEANVADQRKIFDRMLDLSPGRGLMVNNHDWLGKLGYIEVLRDIGKHFSVNAMVQRDSVRDRLSRNQGLSYTEFSYMILQAYDYLYLREHEGVTLQMGGSDQWGNIVSGADLCRRILKPGQNEAFALVTPLVTKSDGGKFGKSESGAIWLSPDRTSPYAFYQFWLNTADDDVLRYLKIFSTYTEVEVAELALAHEGDRSARTAQRALARNVTEFVHGAAARDQAEAAGRALFSVDIAALPADTLEEVLEGAPSTEHDRTLLEGGLPLVEALLLTSLVKSKREAREFLQGGAVAVNGQVVGLEYRLSAADLLHDRIIAIRRGKKAWHVTRWSV